MAIIFTKSQSYNFQKRLSLLSKMESLNLQLVAVLMPLEIKRHKIPHLKALTCSIEHANGQGGGSTFIYQNSYLKSTSYRNKRT